MYKFGILKNDKIKQIVFRFFYRGISIDRFNVICSGFSNNIDRILIKNAIRAIEAHQKEGNTVIIISASIENWIMPWAAKQGINQVLATKIEIDPKGFLTGNFKSANCYGQEKKNRLIEAYPNRSEYSLYVYGDSPGDNELMEFADFSFYRQF